MTTTAIATPDHGRLRERIASLLDLTYLAEGELHLAIYRARLAGVPDDELTHLASLDPGGLARIVASFHQLAHAELVCLLEAPDMQWRNANGLGSYG